jgi:hypothetical protein
VVVELDDRGQVFHGLDFLTHKREHGGEVVLQLAVDALLVGQAVIGILAYDGMQVVAALPSVEEKQPTIDQVVEGGLELLLTSPTLEMKDTPFTSVGIQDGEGIVAHGAAVGGNAAEQIAFAPVQGVVGYLEDVVLLLAFELRQHRMAFRHLDITRIPPISHDQPGQEAQSQGVIAVGGTGILDLSAGAADPLGVKEDHGVLGVQGSQLLVAAAGQVVIQFPRQEAAGEEDATLKRQGGYLAQEVPRMGINAVTEIRTRVMGQGVSLIGSREAGVGTKLTLEAVQNQEKSPLLEQPEQCHNLIVGRNVSVGVHGAVAGVGERLIQERSEGALVLVEGPPEDALRTRSFGYSILLGFLIGYAWQRQPQDIPEEPGPGEGKLAHPTNRGKG